MMGWAYSRGVEATCGCFGYGETVSPRTLLRDSALFAIAVYLTVYSWKTRRARSLPDPEAKPAPAPSSTPSPS